jgi:hypothetical protein
MSKQVNTGSPLHVRTERTGTRYEIHLQQLAEEGFTTIPNIITAKEIAAISRALAGVAQGRAGTRNLLDRAWCRALASRIKLRLADLHLLPSAADALQCTFFDKTPQRNWLVALHQDLSIPVKAGEAQPIPGACSEKEGQRYIQAPPKVLENLLAVRVHIDDCGLENGALRVVPGSHLLGRLSEEDARQYRNAAGEVACAAQRGDALLMRPLLLHASSKAVTPSRRRVLHFLFAPPELSF